MCGGGEDVKRGKNGLCDMFIRKEKLLLDCQEGGGVRGTHVRSSRKRRTYSFQTRTRRRSVVLSWTRVTRACSSWLAVSRPRP